MDLELHILEECNMLLMANLCSFFTMQAFKMNVRTLAVIIARVHAMCEGGSVNRGKGKVLLHHPLLGISSDALTVMLFLNILRIC